MATTKYGALPLLGDEDALSITSSSSIHVYVNDAVRPTPGVVQVHVRKPQAASPICMCMLILGLFFGGAVLGGVLLVWDYWHH